MTHSWGFLGSWMGQVSFRYAGQQGDLQRFPYRFNLTYVPPKADARNVLFPVSGASFKHGEAGGTIYFDPVKRRVSRVEERFRVHGQMNIEVLGQNLPVDLDEEQSFQVRLLGVPILGCGKRLSRLTTGFSRGQRAPQARRRNDRDGVENLIRISDIRRVLSRPLGTGGSQTDAL